MIKLFNIFSFKIRRETIIFQHMSKWFNSKIPHEYDMFVQKVIHIFCNLILILEKCQSICNPMMYNSHPSNFAWGMNHHVLKTWIGRIVFARSILHGRLFNYVWNCQFSEMMQARKCYSICIINHILNCFSLVGCPKNYQILDQRRNNKYFSGVIYLFNIHYDWLETTLNENVKRFSDII